MAVPENVRTAALFAAGVFVLVMMQVRSSDSALAQSRSLAGDESEYAGATRSLGYFFYDGEPWRIIVATTLVLILGSLAAGAGIGGGGLFVPIYMVLLGAGPKGAVPLSKATILGGAIGNFLTLSRARHPKAERPMIDYEASTFMQSGELLGVVFGVLLNGLLPAILIIVFLLAILSYNSYKTFSKGFAARKKEDAAFKKAAEDEAAAVSGKAAEDEAAE